MNDDVPEDLIYAAFFFIDIVGLSNPIISTETQRTKIEKLSSMIYDCKIFESANKKELFILPTGDGMLLGFKDGLEQPISLAIELHRKLRKYNEHAQETEKILTRIGCNIGHIFIVKDKFGNVNLWGPGAVLARRVMDLGEADHILLPSNLVNDLLEMSDKYEKMIFPIHNFTVKHGEELLVYSAHGEDFGNSTPPKKANQITKTIENKNSTCQKIIFNIKVRDSEKTSMTFERIYDFVNNSTEPIYDIQIEIMSHTELSIKDLNIQVFDEDDQELEISKITSTDYSKQLTIKLNRPVFRGSLGHMIRVIYEKNEPSKFFEHRFLMDTDSFELNFITPKNISEMNPKFFVIDKNNNKYRLEAIQKIPKGMSHVTTWQKNDKMFLGDIIRLEYGD